MPTNDSTDTPAVEKDPELTPTPPPFEPVTDLGKKAKDSDPLPESDWMGKPVERPYAEAITPAHREFLAASGIPVPLLDKD